VPGPHSIEIDSQGSDRIAAKSKHKKTAPRPDPEGDTVHGSRRGR
jgi:hypothetical protein